MKIDKNLPNYLTFMRILSIPIIIVTFYFQDSKLAHRLGAIIFLIAALTDFLDGYIARKFSLISNLGKMLDPIADKVLIGSVLLMLVKFNKANEIACMLILAREFIVSGLREFLAQIRVSLPVSSLAKVKTFLQMAALTMLILGNEGSGFYFIDDLGHILLWVSAMLTIFTGISYFIASSRYILN